MPKYKPMKGIEAVAELNAMGYDVRHDDLVNEAIMGLLVAMAKGIETLRGEEFQARLKNRGIVMDYNNQLDDDIKMLNGAGFKAIAKQYKEMVIVLQRAVRQDEISDKDFRDQFFTLAALKLRRFANGKQKWDCHGL